MKHIKYFNSMDEFKSNAESIPTPCVCVTENDGGQMCSYRASDDKEFQHYQGGEKVEVSLDPYEAIDLGLPSGRLWANMNVGATKPEESGLYFQPGYLKGHTNDKVGTWISLQFATGDLSLDRDPARAYMGGCWRMPSSEDINELLYHCNYTWKYNGFQLTSKNNGASIFFPYTGQVSINYISGPTSYGAFLGSSYYFDEDAEDYVYGGLYFMNDKEDGVPMFAGLDRSVGSVIRAVK